MSFRVLGPLEVCRPGGAEVKVGAGKPAALLSALLVHANAWVSVDQLITMIWQEQDAPPSAERNLKTYVWRLRRDLPPASAGLRIESAAGAYRLRVEPGELDLDVAQRMLDSAECAAHAGDVPAAIERLTGALELWRGLPYGGIEHDWAASAVAVADRLHGRIRGRLADLYAEAGRYDDATVIARELADEDPLREDSWARLVMLLHRGGRRAEALDVFVRARNVLRTELGVEPGIALGSAYRTVLLSGSPSGDTADLAHLEELLVGAVRAVQTAVRLADRIGVTVPDGAALALAVGGVPA